MLGLMRDQIWTFIGIIVAVMSILVAIWIYRAQRLKKRILVETVTSFPLITLGRDGIPGLQININGSEVQNPIVYVVKIENIGNTVISPLDYEEPVTLLFSDDAQVLSAAIIERLPADLSIEISHLSNTVKFDPKLLNPGDKLVARVLMHKSMKKYMARGRIAGVQRIETTRPDSKKIKWGDSMFLGAATPLVIIGFTGENPLKDGTHLFLLLIQTVTFITFLSCCFALKVDPFPPDFCTTN